MKLKCKGCGIEYIVPDEHCPKDTIYYCSHECVRKES